MEKSKITGIWFLGLILGSIIMSLLFLLNQNFFNGINSLFLAFMVFVFSFLISILFSFPTMVFMFAIGSKEIEKGREYNKVKVLFLLLIGSIVNFILLYSLIEDFKILEFIFLCYLPIKLLIWNFFINRNIKRIRKDERNNPFFYKQTFRNY